MSCCKSGCIITVKQLERCICRPPPPQCPQAPQPCPPQPCPPNPPSICPVGFTAVTDTNGNVRCASTTALTVPTSVGCIPGFTGLAGVGGQIVCSPNANCDGQMLPGGATVCPDGSMPQCIQIQGRNGYFKSCPSSLSPSPNTCIGQTCSQPGFAPLPGIPGQPCTCTPCSTGATITCGGLQQCVPVCPAGSSPQCGVGTSVICQPNQNQCPQGFTSVTDLNGNVTCASTTALNVPTSVGCIPGFTGLAGVGGQIVCSPNANCDGQMLPGGATMCPDGSMPQCIQIQGRNGYFKACPQ